jgi:hypothetical protein
MLIKKENTTDLIAERIQVVAKNCSLADLTNPRAQLIFFPYIEEQ